CTERVRIISTVQTKTLTRILIVDDHAIVRSGIRALLETSGMEIVGEASDGLEAVRVAAEAQPDLILMDVAMPKANGIQAARENLTARPGALIIMLSMHSEEEYVYEALRAGVAGYVLKDAVYAELVSAIHMVAGGRTYLNPFTAEVVRPDFIRPAQ